MKKVCISAQVVGIALAGCSTASNDVVPTQLSRYDCAQIAAEQLRMYTRAGEFASLGPSAREAEYARLRGEHDALREAAVMKKCGRASVPALHEATSDASAALGDTGPRIAPPETPLE